MTACYAGHDRKYGETTGDYRYHIVPAADSGQDVTDYTTAFTVTTHLVSDGAVTILLGEDPVLVEEDEWASFPVYLPLVLR